MKYVQQYSRKRTWGIEVRHLKKFKTVVLSASLLVILLTVGCNLTPAVPQQAKDAVIALKKIEARIQAGINYPDYVVSVGEAMFSVNMFADSPDSKKHQELNEAIGKAMADYQLAGDIWKLTFEKALQSRDPGVYGALRLTDSKAQDILSKMPSLNKPVGSALMDQIEHNTLVLGRKLLGSDSPSDVVIPLTPKKDDGCVFEHEGYPNDRQIGDRIYSPAGSKPEMIQYVNLEIAFRLLWLRAGENLATAYKMTLG